MPDSFKKNLTTKEKTRAALTALFSSVLWFILLFFLAMYIVDIVYPPYTIDPVTGKKLCVMATEQLLISLLISLSTSILVFVILLKRNKKSISSKKEVR